MQTSTVPLEFEDSSNASTSDNQATIILSSDTSDANSESNDSVNPKKKRKVQPPHQKTKKKTDDENSESELMERALTIMEQRNDEWDVFGQFIASELRQITDSLTRNSMKRKIMMILCNGGSPQQKRSPIISSDESDS